ncbi:MAG: hypothetical protein WCF99_10325 [Chloroflexales bacterium]
MVHRNDVVAKINERICGQISDAAIATWAFDLFYSIEQGEEEVDAEGSDAIADVLDELMFADEKPFALDDADLRRLIARLE